MAEEQENKYWTPMFRASFTEHAFAPKIEAGKVPKYSFTMLFPKETVDEDPLFIAMREAAEAALEAKFGKKAVKGKTAKGYKRPFLDGDEKPWDGYEDCWFIRVTSKFPPKFVGRDGQTPILDESGFYAGCFAHATVNTFCYEAKEGNKGVSFGIQNCQFIKDGDPFSGGTAAEDDFSALPDDGESAAGDGEIFDEDE